jgi:2,3-bisphosphoglycerate-independent phosphoglycerate mutase
MASQHGLKRVYIHAFLDGRDTPPASAVDYIHSLEKKIEEIGCGQIASMIGRYYAMDRDKRWERTQLSYDAIVDAMGPRSESAAAAVKECYADSACSDELMRPHVVGEGAPMQDGDAVIFFNFRPDRARQLTSALMQKDFNGFPRERAPRDLTFVTLTDYKVDLPGVRVAFAPAEVVPMARVLSETGLKQFHTAETEKYAHVTYFFNGGQEPPFPGEDRIMVPSVKVATYDLQPEMSAAGVADALVKAIESRNYDFAIVNFANPDMVGHTGDFEATCAAMAATDAAVGRVVDAALAAGGCVLVTADHGNAEELLFPDGGRNTQHSMNLVPVVFAAGDGERFTARDGGLRDIAPTLLGLLELPVPSHMTGRSLLSR